MSLIGRTFGRDGHVEQTDAQTTLFHGVTTPNFEHHYYWPMKKVFTKRAISPLA
jgi:hypothetical protein